MSRTSTTVKNRWNKAHYDRLNITVPKGMKEKVSAWAEEHGQSLNSLVNDLLRYEMGLSEKEWKQGGREGA